MKQHRIPQLFRVATIAATVMAVSSPAGRAATEAPAIDSLEGCNVV